MSHQPYVEGGQSPTPPYTSCSTKELLLTDPYGRKESSEPQAMALMFAEEARPIQPTGFHQGTQCIASLLYQHFTKIGNENITMSIAGTDLLLSYELVIT